LNVVLLARFMEDAVVNDDRQPCAKDDPDSELHVAIVGCENY
jgi:hypothetical protein